MHFKILISFLCCATWSVAQDQSCREFSGTTFSGQVRQVDAQQMELKVEGTKGLRVGQYVEVLQSKSMGINNGKMSWSKKIAEGRLTQISGQSVKVGELKKETQDGVLMLLDVLLDVKIDENLEVRIMQDYPCLDTLETEEGFSIGCLCMHKKGEWKYYSDHGVLQRIEQYDAAGDRTGAYREFEDNRLRIEGTYRVNVAVGTWTKYYPNGAPYQIIHYDSLGVMQSARQQFEDGNRWIEIEALEATNPKTYAYSWTDENGILRYFGHFDDQFVLRDSLEIVNAYGTRTRLLLIQPQECTLRTFHESGKLASEEIYTIEAVHVQWQRKDVMGLPQIVEPKIEGLKTGTWRTFRPSGELSWQGSYENDLKHGVFEHYQNGGLQRSENYLLDVPSGDWVWYFQAGVVERQCQYNAGKLHGKYLENYANGQLKLSAEYVFDSLVGRYESYFETGQLMESGNYGQYAQAGQRIGTWLSFYEDGRKKAQGTYLEGVKTGTWTYWDESGKKRKEKYE